MTERRFDRPGLFCLLLVIVASLPVYLHTIGMDFVYDDLAALKEPSIIWSPNLLEAAFTGEGSRVIGGYVPYYRPLHIISLGLDHILWNVNPVGFHLTNIILHAAAAALVFTVALQLLPSLGAATAAGLIFALHPVQAEAVTWISARGDIICAIFMLGSFAAYLRSIRQHNNTVFALSLTLLFCALLSKEMAITLPLLIAIHAFFLSGARGKRLCRLLWYLLPCAVYLGLRFSFLHSQSWEDIPFLWRFATGWQVLLRYVLNALLPFDLRIFYDIPVLKSPAAISVLVPLALVLLLAGGGLFLLARRRPEGFGILWFLIALIPVTPFLVFLHPSLMADRYQYIPMVGICLAGGGVWGTLHERWGKNIWLPTVVLLAILAAGAFLRTLPWKDQTSFMRQVVQDAPRSFFGYFCQGNLLRNEGRYDEALEAFTNVLRLSKGMPEAHYCKGVLLFYKGQLAGAESEFLTVTRLDPRYWRAYTNLGIVYLQQGRPRDAAAVFRQALQLNPNDTVARDKLKMALSLLQVPQR